MAIFLGGGLDHRAGPSGRPSGSSSRDRGGVAPIGRAFNRVRFSDGSATLAYSGDTEWTDALVSIADGAQLFIVECSGYAGRIPYHLTWEVLAPRLSDLRARQIMITHMNSTILAHLDEVRAAGVLVAEDGDVIEL